MKIVLLVGPSSAGKSTICAELRDKHQWKVLSMDEVIDMIRSEQEETILKELRSAELITQLSGYMCENEVLKLCVNGMLTISKGSHKVTNHRFSSPDFVGKEDVLREAQFNDVEIALLSKLFHSVGEVFKNGENKFPNPLERLYSEAFSHLSESAPVIIDIVPPELGDAKKMLDEFDQQIKRYRSSHDDQSIDAFTVFAYCPPQELSQRIIKRNVEAESIDDQKNKREGMFPFYQLSTLVGTQESAKSTDHPIGEVSNEQLMKIAHEHRQSKHKKDKPPTLRTAAESVIEYGRLAKKYGLVKEEKNKATLFVRHDLTFDTIINTADGDPKMLAGKVLDAIRFKSVAKRSLK